MFEAVGKFCGFVENGKFSVIVASQELLENAFMKNGKSKFTTVTSLLFFLN
jgi:hypothetical protein